MENEFLRICDMLVPITHKRIRKKSNPWFNQNIQEMIYKRDHLHKSAIKDKNDQTWQSYREMRNRVTAEVRKAKKTYYSEKINSTKSDPASMWKTLRTVLPSLIFLVETYDFCLV